MNRMHAPSRSTPGLGMPGIAPVATLSLLLLVMAATPRLMAQHGTVYLNLGIRISYVAIAGGHLMLGAEASITYFSEADYTLSGVVLGYDFSPGVRLHRLRIGGEAGLGPLGIEAGGALVLDSMRLRPGLFGAGFLGGILYGHAVVTTTLDRTFHDIGLLMKYPHVLKPEPETW